ncbi:MAG: sugar phosphate isomerase/epimerase [Verrucomicrobia bacterium]|nr:sugar phosphate isomerase/epimerase [Verrucomicrobiota bacterium]
MAYELNRRGFLKRVTILAPAFGLPCVSVKEVFAAEKTPLFRISLAEWSLNKALFGKKLDHLDFPKTAKRDYGIDAIELVNQFFMDKATDQKYLGEFKKRADGEGVKVLLIMCDDEGNLGDIDPAKRRKAVENHHKWADAAKYFGCHSIRVNAETGGVGGFEDQQKRAADGLRSLSEYGAKLGLHVIVENHGGLSSNGAWLAGVMRIVNLPNCGTLPDFGNFDLGDGKQYDRYKGVTEMIPFAKAVSAKSHDFDAQGNEIHTDYRKMLRIVLDAGYRGYFGIEYEGEKLSEPEGIKATKKLLEKVRSELSQ